MYKVEIPQNLMDSLKKIKKYEPIEESLLIRQALQYGIKDIEKELAIKLFSEGKTTISESAEIAELSVGEMMELLVDRGIKSKITLKDYEEGLSTAIEAL
jgi:predicted HTH domain antitoxin